jgi:putative tricarboxylic transport membrane protein
VGALNINILTGIVVTLVGVGYGLMAYTLPHSTVGNPIEPKVFPLIIAAGMTVLGIILTIRESRIKAAKTKGINLNDWKKMLNLDTRLIIFTCVMTILYALIFEHAGYVISTTVYMAALLFALNDGMKKWLTNILVAVGFSVGIYLLFSMALGIPLPMLPYFEI